MYSDKPPFLGNNREEIEKKILTENPNFDDFTVDLKNLIKKMLIKDP